MAYTIAVSGKGGTGKTTLVALAIRYLVREQGRAVLAVDADPNSTLGLALGVETEGTIADIREDVLERKIQLSPGESKERHIEYCIQQSIQECAGFDMLTMGRPEGPKCYCYVNHLLRGFLDNASEDYPFVVIDNEAGMEHLSRRTTNNVDLLLIVAEPTVIGVRSATRVAAIGAELPIVVKKRAAILNRCADENVPQAILEHVQSAGLEVRAVIPTDATLTEMSVSGASLMDVPDDNPAYQAVGKLLSEEMASAAQTVRPGG